MIDLTEAIEEMSARVLRLQISEERHTPSMRVAYTMADLEALACEKLSGQWRYGKRATYRSSVQRELEYLITMLLDGETVINLAIGDYKDRLGRGLVALTNRRVVFIASSGFGGGRANVEDFPFSRIASVLSQRGTGSSKLNVQVEGAQARIHNVMPVERTDEIAQYIRQRINSNGAMAPADGAAEPDILVQLMRLGELRDAGVVTDDEFVAKKADLLARL